MKKNKKPDNRIIVANTKKINSLEIYFADIETCVINNTHYPIALGAISAKEESTFFYETVNTENMDSLKLRENHEESTKAVKKFFDRFEKDCIIYFHNLGRFDAYVLFNYLLGDESYDLKQPIERDRVMYSIRHTNKHKAHIELRDSYLITNTAINSFYKHKLSTLKKVENNQELYKDMLHHLKTNKPAVIKVLERDICILREGMLIVQSIIQAQFKYDIFKKSLTIAGITFDVFLQNYNNIEKNPIYKLTISEDAWIRRAYHGGLTEVYKPYAKTGWVYDINSSYPKAMTEDLPVGKPKRIKDTKNLDINKFFGFVEAMVYIPENIKLPPLMIEDSERGLICPTGTFEGVWWSEELAFAATYPGVIIDPIDAYSFDRGKPFEEYIKTLYGMRLTAKKKEQTALAQIIKLFLNSLYGRFGMQIKRTKIAYLTRKEIEGSINNTILDYEKNPIEYTNKHRTVLKTLKTKEELTEFYPDKTMDQIEAIYEFQGMETKTCVAVAAAITAKGRINLRKFILECNLEGHLLYNDTDSIVTDKQITNKNIIGDQLGQLKLEAQFTDGYFVDIKSYTYTDQYGNKKITFKGVPIAQRDEKTIEELFKEHVKKYNTNKYEFIDNTQNFVRDYKTMTVIIKNYKDKPVKHLDYNKRQKVIINKVWVDTKPIHKEPEIYYSESEIDSSGSE